MLFSFLFALPRGGNDSLIIRLAAAGGKGDLPRLGADAGGHVLPRLPERLRGLLPRCVQARRISVNIRKTPFGDG